MREVFISYKSNDPVLGNNDETVANELCQALEAAGITCWIAPRDIPFGSDYDDCIVEAIETCKVMLVVFSHYTLKSKYVYEEVRIAYENEKDIIRYKLDDAQLKGKWNLRLGAKQWIDATGDNRTKIPELIIALQNTLGEEQALVNIATPTLSDGPITPIISNVLPISFKGITFNMVHVEGGTFMMGAKKEDKDAFIKEQPVHEVTLSDYWIGETQVTQELWQAVMGKNPSKFKSSPNQPVECVSWENCQEFIERLNCETGRKFCLPTEAQWEFSARGGKKGCKMAFKYAGREYDLDAIAWYKDNSNGETHPVAEKAPNELGIYDMCGNVFEWCLDNDVFYTSDSQNNPRGSDHSSFFVMRGGSWKVTAKYCRVSYRDTHLSSMTSDDFGLRLALDE